MLAEPDEEATGLVHLTFDDGPDRQWTPRVLDLLARTRARATFFVVGTTLRGQTDLLRRIAAEGHTIGNHTWSHCHPWTMRSSRACSEVRGGAHAIEDALGVPSALFRPPHGAVRQCMTDEAAALGQRLVLWDRSALDWGPWATPAAIARRLGAMRPGEIVLMHDRAWGFNHPEHLMQALPDQLRALLARGWRCVGLEPQGHGDIV